MIGQLHTWLHSGCECTHNARIKSQQGSERVSWSHIPTWGAIGNEWLLGRERLPMPPSGWSSHTHIHANSTKWTKGFCWFVCFLKSTLSYVIKVVVEAIGIEGKWMVGRLDQSMLYEYMKFSNNIPYARTRYLTHAYNLRSWGIEAERWWVWGQPKQQCKTWSSKEADSRQWYTVLKMY